MIRFVLLLALVPALASAREAGPPLGVEATLKGGLLVPFADLGVAPSVALEGAWALPVLDRKLLAGLELRFGQPGARGSLSSPHVQGGVPFPYSFDLSMLTVAVPVAYRHDAGAWSARGGAAPALVLAAATSEAFVLRNRQTDTRLGLDLFGAFDYRAGPGFLTGEARVAITGVDFLATGPATLASLTFSAGYRYRF